MGGFFEVSGSFLRVSLRFHRVLGVSESSCIALTVQDHGLKHHSSLSGSLYSFVIISHAILKRSPVVFIHVDVNTYSTHIHIFCGGNVYLSGRVLDC